MQYSRLETAEADSLTAVARHRLQLITEYVLAEQLWFLDVAAQAFICPSRQTDYSGSTQHCCSLQSILMWYFNVCCRVFYIQCILMCVKALIIRFHN